MKYLRYWSLSKISLNKDGVMWRYFSQLNEMNMRRFFVWQKGQWSQLRYTDRKSWGWAVQRSGYIIRGRKLYVSVSCSNKISCPLLLILTWMMIAQSLKKTDVGMSTTGCLQTWESCKMSANQNSGIQMSTHILAKKYTISKNLIPIYDPKGLISSHKGIHLM